MDYELDPSLFDPLAIAFANTTTIHPLALAVLAIMVIWSLRSKRVDAIKPFVIFLLLVPAAQRISIFALDFTFIRIYIYILIIVAMSKSYHVNLKSVSADKIIIAWAIWGVIAQGLLEGSLSASIGRIGYVSEVIGAYFVGRLYARENGSIESIRSALIAMSVISFFLFLNEYLTNRNLFHVFGGVPEFTRMREGKLRCQGPFSHPILAGVFWGSMIPILFIRKDNSGNFLLYAAVISVVGIVLMTSSSTPAMALIISLLGVYGYRYRSKLNSLVMFGFIALMTWSLLSGHPPYYIFARIDLVGGSTGWHRYYLIDRAISNFAEWWAFGVLNTSHWGEGLEDVTNQYVLEGVRTGFMGMILYILLLRYVYLVYKKNLNNNLYDKSYWNLGVVFWSNVAVLFTVSYFGQNTPLFYLFLGMIVSIGMKESGLPKAKDSIISYEVK